MTKEKITTHSDCRKAWEMVAADMLKVSQLSGDGCLIVNRIMEIKSKSNIESEHAHMSAKKMENNTIVNKGFNMVLECDKLTKE